MFLNMAKTNTPQDTIQTKKKGGENGKQER